MPVDVLDIGILRTKSHERPRQAKILRDIKCVRPLKEYLAHS